MTRSRLLVVLTLGFAVAAVGLTGCSSKKKVAPVTPAPVATTTRPEPQRPAAPSVTPSAPAQREDEVPRDLAFATVYFDYDQSSIRQDQQSALEQNAQLLNRYKTVTVRLEGHCDERGTEEYNMALGQRRADAVQEYLTRYGITGTRISTVSYGEMRPAASGQMESSWSKNRRCEIIITAR